MVQRVALSLGAGGQGEPVQQRGKTGCLRVKVAPSGLAPELCDFLLGAQG